MSNPPQDHIILNEVRRAPIETAVVIRSVYNSILGNAFVGRQSRVHYGNVVEQHPGLHVFGPPGKWLNFGNPSP